MKRILNILVIFLMAIIITIIIYKKEYKQNINILVIGDELSLGVTPFGNINNSYVYYLKRNNNYNITTINKPKLTYDELYNMIYFDKKIYYKGEYTNIKNIIKQNNIIILNANTNKSLNKCNKNNRIYKEYLDNTFEKTTKIIDQIYITGTNKVIVLSPYCTNNNEKITKYIDKYYNYKITTYINLNKILNEKSYYLPSQKTNYPSLEGYNKIQNELNIIINDYIKNN